MFQKSNLQLIIDLPNNMKNLKSLESKIEEQKHEIKSLVKKNKELETAESLTKWKIINFETKVHNLQEKEKELLDRIIELKKTINERDLKILKNITTQDEITEEKDTYKARYDKLSKDFIENRREASRFKNN